MKIDKNQAATIVVGTVIASVIIFLLQKYLTKTVSKTTPAGAKETSQYVGHEAVGYI